MWPTPDINVQRDYVLPFSVTGPGVPRYAVTPTTDPRRRPMVGSSPDQSSSNPVRHDDQSLPPNIVDPSHLGQSQPLFTPDMFDSAGHGQPDLHDCIRYGLPYTINDVLYDTPYVSPLRMTNVPNSLPYAKPSTSNNGLRSSSSLQTSTNTNVHHTSPLAPPPIPNIHYVPQKSPLVNTSNVPAADTPVPSRTQKIVLVLLLDHEPDSVWAKKRGQNLLRELEANNYTAIASSPASAILSITRYNPSIILIINATTLNKSINRDSLIKALTIFTEAGGTLLFGGVPSALNPPSRSSRSTAITVFKTAFRLNWTVGADDQMEVGATSKDVRIAKFDLSGTCLNNVPLNQRLYRPNSHKIANKEPCGVALAKYGNGAIGYLGSEDLFSRESMILLIDMCKIGQEQLRSGDMDKTPGEIISGGKMYGLSGWGTKHPDPSVMKIAIGEGEGEERVKESEANLLKLMQGGGFE